MRRGKLHTRNTKEVLSRKINGKELEKNKYVE
jgi:hypothetical protein